MKVARKRADFAKRMRDHHGGIRRDHPARPTVLKRTKSVSFDLPNLPDSLRSYEAQSYPVIPRRPWFNPPVDYPVDDLAKMPSRRPRTPPPDYDEFAPGHLELVAFRSYYEAFSEDHNSRPPDPPVDYYEERWTNGNYRRHHVELENASTYHEKPAQTQAIYRTNPPPPAPPPPPPVVKKIKPAYQPINKGFSHRKLDSSTDTPVKNIEKVTRNGFSYHMPNTPTPPTTPAPVQAPATPSPTKNSRIPPQPQEPAPTPPHKPLVWYPDMAEAANIAGDNRAFLHHIKNHQQFDTVRRHFCDSCQICQAMKTKDRDFYVRTLRHYQKAKRSPFTSRTYLPFYDPEIFAEEEEEDLGFDQGDLKAMQEDAFVTELRNRRAVVAKALVDRKKRNSSELSINKGEILEVVSSNNHWWMCANSIGSRGFVADSLLQILPRQ